MNAALVIGISGNEQGSAENFGANETLQNEPTDPSRHQG